MLVTNKIVFITGATGDLGRSLCEKLATKQYGLILHSSNRSIEKIQSFSSDVLKKTKYVVAADLNQPDEIRKICDTMLVRGIPIYSIINNAGVGINKNISECSYDEIRKVIDVNMMAPILMMNKLLGKENLLDVKQIVNINSYANFCRVPNFSVYTASKVGLSAFMDCARMELDHRVKIVNVYPGKIETRMLENYKKEISESLQVEEVANIVMNIIDTNNNITDITLRIT